MRTPRRAKIVCTLGPSSSSPETIGELIDAGMNAARLNLSHGTHEDHQRRYALVRELAAQRNVAVAVLADLQGPKLRVGNIPAPGFDLVTGSEVVISTDPAALPMQDPTTTRVTTTYEHLHEEVALGDVVLLDDGQLELRVEGVRGREVLTRCIQGGRLTSHKGLNLPGTKLRVEALGAKDRADLEFVLRLGVDAVALSFVRRPEDVTNARALMHSFGYERPIVSKIEKPEAIVNLDAIMAVSDGIMVARGDLGVEMGPEEVPMLQKRAIQLANRAGKLVITATQMLESMINQPRPTRAEASDVANAVLDGTDAVMLSGETANGRHPALVARTMDRIVRRTEEAPNIWQRETADLALHHTTNAIARAAVSCSHSLPDMRAIVTFTGTGGIARLVSDYRPRVPIYALTPDEQTYRTLALYWGVTPIRFSPTSSDSERIFADIDRELLAAGLVTLGDRIVVTFGHPIAAHRSVNLLKIQSVGEAEGRA